MSLLVPIRQPTSEPPCSPATALFPLTGTGAALLDADGVLSYDDLGNASDEFAAKHLGGTRRVVLLEADNTRASVIAYLAALNHGHVAIVVPPLAPARRDELVRAYDPDVVIGPDLLTQRRDGSAHDLHPDLALLLSTSGSTGSPRMVRLSRDNLQSNAAAIAHYLGLDEADRAITSLPLHYCYGLSVLHSHLAVGAALVLTENSVVDPCFWELATHTGVTTLSTVPHTIDLLDRSGFAERPLPSLRRITQAGGRLAPERVTAMASLGQDNGFDFLVMYGQTEATARMAWLPADRARTHPEAVGVAVPGGSLRIDHPDRSGIGEVVFAGPNVMMGYADSPADLHRGAELSELRTGDLGRIEDGLLHLVGRASRRAKVFGLRIDLDRVERQLSGAEQRVFAVADASTLHLFVPREAGEAAAAALEQRAREFCDLPASAVRVHLLDRVPLTPNGKPDYPALLTSTERTDASGRQTRDRSVRGHFATVIGRPDAGETDTFVGLGGDSLSYVELATRLEQDLPAGLPSDWHLRTIAELAGSTGARRRLARVDTTIALRAVAIVLIVASHVDLIAMEGGAHVLLALAGFNFARFQLASPTRRKRLHNGAISLAQLVVPSVLWIAGVGLVMGTYRPATALFLNDIVGSKEWDDQWQFWFLEALVWLTIASLTVIAFRRTDALERRHPFGFSMGLLAVTALLRFALVGVNAGPTERYSTGVVAFFFMLGWAGARARTLGQRLLVTAVALVLIPGFFDQPQREAIILIGFGLMLWVPTIPVPRALGRALALIASASLFIYLTQWQIYPPLEDSGHPWLALIAAFAFGIGYAALMRPVQRWVRRIGTGETRETA